MNMVVAFETFAKRYSILFQKINLLDIVFKIFEKYQQLYSYLVKLQALELVTLFKWTLDVFLGIWLRFHKHFLSNDFSGPFCRYFKIQKSSCLSLRLRYFRRCYEAVYIKFILPAKTILLYKPSLEKRKDDLETRAVLLKNYMLCWNLPSGP